MISDTLLKSAPEAVPSASLDTCDQVGIFDEKVTDSAGQIVLPWGYGATRPLPGFSQEDLKKQLVESLRACGREREANSVEACHQVFLIGQCDDCGTLLAIPNSCDNRLCPTCNEKRAALLISAHEDVLKNIHNPKMVTLTKRPVQKLTREVFKKFRDDFTKLRHRKVWRVCWGGLYSFEVKRTKRGWYVHLHALVGSGYIDQKELSREWNDITGCPIVDIRAIKNDDKWAGVREVIKYPSKASDFINDSAMVNEFLTATSGVNLVYGFGALYRVKTKKHGGEACCPLCGGHNIDFQHGWGFHVGKDRVNKIRNGWLYRGLNNRAGPEIPCSRGSCT